MSKLDKVVLFSWLISSQRLIYQSEDLVHVKGFLIDPVLAMSVCFNSPLWGTAMAAACQVVLFCCVAPRAAMCVLNPVNPAELLLLFSVVLRGPLFLQNVMVLLENMWGRGGLVFSLLCPPLVPFLEPMIN